MTTAIASVPETVLSNFVLNGPPSQRETRERMVEIDIQLTQLASDMAPLRRELVELTTEYDRLFRASARGTATGEMNARMSEIAADLAELHRKLQPSTEEYELLNQDYARLQRKLTGKP